MQRVPRTEKRGRVHTSTVTVAVLGGSVADLSRFASRSERDFQVEWFNGTVGAGGQKHNKTATCARLLHLPTGIVRTSQTRSRKNSLAEARAAIVRDLDEAMEREERNHVNDLRREQISPGRRAGEKARTFRFQTDQAIDHATGKTGSARRVMKGGLDVFWDKESGA